MTAPTADTRTQARARCATARAWQSGTRLARLLLKHDVPRPAHVRTHSYPDGMDQEGQTMVYATMTSAADLLRLARSTGSRPLLCEGAQGEEQAALHLGATRRQISASWYGPVSGGAA